MFGKASKILQYMRLKVLNDQTQKDNTPSMTVETTPIPTSITKLLEKLEEAFSLCSDFVLREVELAGDVPLKIHIAYINGLVNKQIINEEILKPIMLNTTLEYNDRKVRKQDIISLLSKNLITNSSVEEVEDFNQSLHHILCGYTLIYIDGQSRALKIETQEWETRNVIEPNTESVIRGPREGFVESIGTNIVLLRRKIKNSKLKFESFNLGERTNTNVSICYIEGIAPVEVIKTVKRRLSKIKIDAILESGYIEQFIEDAPLSLFATVGNSEKPDKVAAKILEGRVAILCDGTPFVLTVPNLFIESLQSSEDYYTRSFFGSFNRILRLLAFLTTIFLPAIYVATILHHLTVIPFDLLISVSAAREGVPFSPLIEGLFMVIVFEFLRESGVRMPRPVGQTASIVGALVIGEAAVTAGIVSPIMVIVIALTGICSFIIPSLGDVLPMLRIFFLLGAHQLGYLGILIVLFVLMIHLSSIRSFGVPYLSVLAPTDIKDLKDSIIRTPLWMMITRPEAFNFDHKEDNPRMSEQIIKKED
ncbi:spore germination protein [Alkaliphilus hydrothermalis]|uniref:Spore germination protein KA n=1 Tax=Alkaliphilus hydrothermalis TaxID=1482730 RepID=A0ABS2NT97_9FIRM|nr:spore germination protein [Alkaliphilus hydrothermalis]MBM7615804.1 spore germination protein KA [Alkaliphilus hydrothermalis]